MAEAHQIIVNIEPHGYFTTNPQFMDRMLNFCDSPCLRMNLDTGNTFISGQDPAEYLKHFIDRVSHVHVKDVPASLAESRGTQTGIAAGDYSVLGEGVNVENIEKCLVLLRDHGYNGALSMECEGRGGPLIERSLKWMRETLAEAEHPDRRMTVEPAAEASPTCYGSILACLRPFMTGKQRIRAAMRHEPVDRVPVMCQLAIGHYLLKTDIKPAELWFTSEGFAKALVVLARRYGFDGVMINLPGRDPQWMRHVLRIEDAADGGQTVFFRNGESARCPPDDNVQHLHASVTAVRKSTRSIRQGSTTTIRTTWAG